MVISFWSTLRREYLRGVYDGRKSLCADRAQRMTNAYRRGFEDGAEGRRIETRGIVHWLDALIEEVEADDS